MPLKLYSNLPANQYSQSGPLWIGIGLDKGLAGTGRSEMAQRIWPQFQWHNFSQ
jgi:hypothetical protein